MHALSTQNKRPDRQPLSQKCLGHAALIRASFATGAPACSASSATARWTSASVRCRGMESRYRCRGEVGQTRGLSAFPKKMSGPE